MFLLYLDESGVPETHPEQTSHYVVIGLAVHEGTWFALDRQVSGLKRRFGLPNRDNYEIHAAWVLNRYREQEQIPGFEELSWQARHDAVQRLREERRAQQREASRKSRQRESSFFRKTEPFIHLTREERQELVRSALTIVRDYRRGLFLFGEAINKETLNPAVDPIEESFDHLVARFERFLRERSSRHWGLITADHNDTQARRLPKMLAEFQRGGTRWANIDHVIEAPFFVDSSGCSGVQVADVCAYALRRYLERQEEELFRLIFPKFYRRRNRLVGLRHFTEPGCPCMICRERKHG